jgi:hypothetical protein
MVACAVLGLAIAPGAAAVTSSQSFTSTGAEQVFTVPAAVTSVNALLVGAYGGAGSQSVTGGAPATIQATIAVTPGEKLYVEVGGDGSTATGPGGGSGGFNGGGGGGDVVLGGPSGAGGGGGSDIRTCAVGAAGCSTLASRLIVAGGGGGAGGSGANGAGGYGGPADTPPGGGNGQPDGVGDDGGTGGGKASASAGGAAGVGGGNVGLLGTGGDGAYGAFYIPGGGGGGGGLYGGGGGGAGNGQMPGSIAYSSGAGGGGGGSSGVPLGAQGVSNVTLAPTDIGAEPHVTVTWTLPTPAVVTGLASGLTSTKATLNGTVNPNNSSLSSCSFTISPAPPAGSSVSCAQQVPNGGVPVPVSAQLFGLTPSTTYTVTLSAANIAGPASGSPVTFTTSAPPPPPPVISKLHVARRIHRVAGKHAKTHNTISLNVSQPGQLTFTFARKHHKTFVRVKGTLVVPAVSGLNKVPFGGLLGRKRLPLGSYRLTVVAASAAGQRSTPESARFKLVG